MKPEEKSKFPCQECGSNFLQEIGYKNAVLIHKDWCKFKKDEQRIIIEIKRAQNKNERGYAEEKAIVLGALQGKYKCPNCNRPFQIKELGKRKYYKCPKCGTLLEV